VVRLTEEKNEGGSIPGNGTGGSIPGNDLQENLSSGVVRGFAPSWFTAFLLASASMTLATIL
jgi:hypothetical protein